MLLFDGVFLLRPETINYWDYTVFVDAPFEVTLRRAMVRDLKAFGSAEELNRRYRSRYIPGQQLYLSECRPTERAEVVINNNDPDEPSATFRS